MSRLGYITKKLAEADERGEQADLTDADLRWAAEWERWDLVTAAGYDADELREQLDLSKSTGADPVAAMKGVPRVGSDREMRVTKRGQVVTVDPEQTDPDDDEVEADEPPDYEAMKVEELRAELKARQLPADGNKDVLIARLEEDDEGDDD